MYTGIRYTTRAPKFGAPSTPRATHGTHRRQAANRQIQADQNDGNDELSSSPSPSIVFGHHQTVQAVDNKSGQLHLEVTDSSDPDDRPRPVADDNLYPCNIGVFPYIFSTSNRPHLKIDGASKTQQIRWMQAT
ncbi:hypothetical protein ACLOJK_037273 [Asimina triloba]